MRFQAPRGTEDVLPNDSHAWIWIERQFRQVATQYGYREIRTPMFEDTDLFVRSSGETSDIVTKQMYSFDDKGGRNITLKPEGTAPAIRAALEHNLCQPGAIVRLSYITPFFRYERPQKGRLRQAHQCGLEILGANSPAADAEVIEATVQFYGSIGIKDVKVLLNSIGREVARETYRQAILNHMASFLSAQSEEDRAKANKNPLRMLDSKDPKVQEALAGLPSIHDFLEPDSIARLDAIQAMLRDAEVPFDLAPEIVRGLDYYTETVFEVHSTHLGSQSALCGGGRYDGLVQELGGPATPAVGVGIGIERAMIVLEAMSAMPAAAKLDVFVVTQGDSSGPFSRKAAQRLRLAGCSVIVNEEGKSLKSQLKSADNSGARFALIVGDEEVAKGEVTLRNLGQGTQDRMSVEHAVKAVVAK